MARATCSGSRTSTSPRGSPVVTAQKRQPRVQTSPSSITVAVPSRQHSPTFLITGANGEIGRSLIERLHAEGRYRVVTLDLTPLPERFGPCATRPTRATSSTATCSTSSRRTTRSRWCSTSRRCSPRAASVTPSSRTRSTSRARCTSCAWRSSSRRGSGGRCASSSRAPSPSTACPTWRRRPRTPGKCEEQFLVPITMYGCNKLYCEHLGRYFMRHYRSRRRGVGQRPLDFRALRFPGLISADTVPDRRHERLRPRDAPRRRAGEAVRVLRGPGGAASRSWPCPTRCRAARAARRARERSPPSLQRRRLQPLGAGDRRRAAKRPSRTRRSPSRPTRAAPASSTRGPATSTTPRARADWGWCPRVRRSTAPSTSTSCRG
jgi:nucleoside-diphosphate-sugar epimerase